VVDESKALFTLILSGGEKKRETKTEKRLGKQLEAQRARSHDTITGWKADIMLIRGRKGTI
jgi:hypothetical protein